MNVNEIIQRLALSPHPTEGGYYRRTYASDLTLQQASASRKILTSIYYMLTCNSPHGYMHKNKSDILHFHHFGSPFKYWIISPDGGIKEQLLGPDITQGQHPQLLVKGGEWKISQLCSGEYGLISEAVVPGFEYADNEIATFEKVRQLFPELMPRLRPYIKN